MNIKFAIPALAAAALMSTAGIAQSGSTGTVAGGVTAAGRDGAVAGGVGAGMSQTRGKADRKADRRGRMNRGGQQATAPNSASTNSSGSVYTSRRNAAAAVTSSGSASGSGSQAAGSTVDAYGETNRNGSNADIYGDSTATSNQQ